MAEFDVLIKGGMVFDGQGRNPRYQADIGIKDGRIAKIGPLPNADAARVIDATGLHVAPGFIDLHTHYDSQVFWDPYCSTSGWHGVTSVVVGNCGFGFAPVREDERERAMLTMTRNEAVPLASMQEGMPWDWVTFPEFMDSLERTPKSVNVLALVPLNPLMVWVMGLDRAKSGVLPTEAEHAEMARLLHEAMDAGAAGVSSQRMGSLSLQRDYDGTPMATDLMHDETMLALAQVLRDRGEGVIQYTYLDVERGIMGDLTNDHVHAHIEDVARVSGQPVIVGGAGEADLEWVASCQERGLRIYGMGLVAGITTTNTTVTLAEGAQIVDSSIEWCKATVGTVDEVKAKFADPEVRERMRAQVPFLEVILGPIGDWVLLRGQTPETAKFDEQKLSHIAPAMGKEDPLDAFLDINIADDLMSKWYFTLQGGGEAAVARHKLMAAAPAMIPGVSDGGAHTKFLTTGNYPTRYLTTYVREHGWHKLEEAHWRLSALPAFVAGFADRGVLVEGAQADIVVYDFDALEVSEQETLYDYPADEWRLADRGIGYHYVLVNGQVTLEHGEQTDVPSGRLLRHGRASAEALATT